MNLLNLVITPMRIAISRHICTIVSAFCFPLLQSPDAWLLVGRHLNTQCISTIFSISRIAVFLLVSYMHGGQSYGLISVQDISVLKMGAIYILVSILFKSYFLDIPALFVVVMRIMTLPMFSVVLIVIAVFVLVMDVAKSRHHDRSLC
jgi:hypothetical protein